ncbi:MAG: hypothetical protein EBU46_19025 [Nitrosomonadaceae bacterium]|nr:hypothetical protein [Nitrosomonadaceae bacterium]
MFIYESHISDSYGWWEAKDGRMSSLIGPIGFILCMVIIKRYEAPSASADSTAQSVNKTDTQMAK